MDSQPSPRLQKFAEHYWPHSMLGLTVGSILDSENKLSIKPLSGDAGFRRYFRVDSITSAILVDSPPKKENNIEYVRTNLLLHSLGVRVPKIYAVDFNSGYFLLEDLGTDHLMDGLKEQTPDDLYRLALKQLDLIQRCDKKPYYIPEYDRSLLLSEMALCSEWFLQKLLGINLDSGRLQVLSDLFESLAQEALMQPKVLVHRDYHSRNLMLLNNDSLAVIDFQDAVWGPITYDLVSLARDCYVRWPSQRVDACVDSYADELLNRGEINTSQHQQFRRWFDLMGLQRHIKVLGIFSRLHLRDAKSNYLKDLPLVLRYTLDVLKQYNEFSDFALWMSMEVIPLCEKQSWYDNWQNAGADSELV